MEMGFRDAPTSGKAVLGTGYVHHLDWILSSSCLLPSTLMQATFTLKTHGSLTQDLSHVLAGRSSACPPSGTQSSLLFSPQDLRLLSNSSRTAFHNPRGARLLHSLLHPGCQPRPQDQLQAPAASSFLTCPVPFPTQPACAALCQGTRPGGSAAEHGVGLARQVLQSGPTPHPPRYCSS